tara:strand:- start:55824 stop:60713 length:4890 start_codon:yes stop_codon:yes gene_type:complete
MSFSISAQTIASYNFESGLQGWTTDTNSALNTNSTWAVGGSRSIYVKDDTNTSIITSPTINLSAYTNVSFTFSIKTNNLENGEGFDLEYHNGTSWSLLKSYRRGTDFVNTGSGNVYTFKYTVTGSPQLSSNSRFRFKGESNKDDEYCYFDNIFIAQPEPEIEISGNTIEIVNGDTTPKNSDHTDFGTANLGTQIKRTYTITNTGNKNLTISSLSLSNTTDFSISIPLYSTPVSSGSSTTFSITFNSVTIGTKTTTITLVNNDSDEFSYQFNISARAEQNFFDSDGDGILDNTDIDDDNDGITDAEEEQACKNSSISTTTNYKFLNETFGEGATRTTINSTYDAYTSYCYEDGTGSCPTIPGIELNDGKYTVYYKAADGDGTNDTPNGEVASWADQYWYTGEDHTAGDTNGRMAMFNASYDPGIFYTATIIGALPNIPITYSFWVLNLDTSTAPGIATRLRPDILVEFRDVNNNVLASISTGDIPPSINGNAAGSWHQFTADLTFNVSEFYVYFINNEVGGAGNDLAIDDITISQTLCDTDGDTVADVFDLDSDNDGIPDVVEAGLGNYSGGNATLTGSGSWLDTNFNGMHDLSEGHIALDSDNDGTPNYLDLDSDNDTLFDVDESGAGNTGNPNYQNGDGDITGDGVGDGPDTDAVRKTDINSDGSIEYYTDGILDIYDYFNGATFNTGYGNQNQGLTDAGWLYYVKDTDNDVLPDYMDVASDGATFDISHTLYANLDANNDGVIDDTNDAEGDGILDLFDTDDAAFGSPRDLNRKLHLYFDGRNDFAAENSVTNGWTEATIMAWVKLDPLASGIQIITGQDVFYLQLNADKSITVQADGNTMTSTTALNTNKWYHIAASYSCDCSTGDFKLYINGIEEASSSISSGPLNTDTSSFTIGRKPDTDSQYFHGYIDEVRVFDKALSKDELQKMIYQEIEDNAGIARGLIIPKDITDFIDESNNAPLNWSHLKRYYRMDSYKDDILDDLTTPSVDVASRAQIHNTKIIDVQSAPLPYISTDSCNGDWSDSSNWLHGDIWDINSGSHSPAAIVQIKGNIKTNTNHATVGLIIDNGSSLEVNSDSELSNSWYLKLDGFMDLQGESQLVQSADSELAISSQGKLERDQQGNKNLFSYNYWSSPVGISNVISNNNSYKLPDVLYDGSIATTPVPITFLKSGYNGNPGNPGTTPISISDYWIWKYANKTTDNYASWQHVRSTGTIFAGEGFTMKGVENSVAAFSQEQNYVFLGKPNNGDIPLTLSAGNDYLIGNPYPSAIDAKEFLLDNLSTASGGRATTNIIDGTLFFWDHFAVASHNLAEYEGGYATYNIIGGLPAISNDARINATGGIGTKVPKQYIPVSQGFFVTANAGGQVMFKNSQRIFKTEAADPSSFLKSSNVKSKAKTSDTDVRKKIRLGFDSPKGYHRQLLVGVDALATNAFDFGYDALLIDTVKEDMFWIFNTKNYVIQGVNNFDLEQILPLGIKTIKEGKATIKIDALENLTSTTNIYLHDKELQIYHDLKQGNYEVFLAVGEYLNRFEITFSKSSQTLGTDEIRNNQIEVLFSNEKKSIVINNPNSNLIESVEMFNILGQSLFKFKTNTTNNLIEYKATDIKTGHYIIKIQTEYGKVSKKVLIK